MTETVKYGNSNLRDVHSDHDCVCCMKHECPWNVTKNP